MPHPAKLISRIHRGHPGQTRCEMVEHARIDHLELKALRNVEFFVLGKVCVAPLIRLVLRIHLIEVEILKLHNGPSRPQPG